MSIRPNHHARSPPGVPLRVAAVRGAGLCEQREQLEGAPVRVQVHVFRHLSAALVEAHAHVQRSFRHLEALAGIPVSVSARTVLGFEHHGQDGKLKVRVRVGPTDHKRRRTQGIVSPHLEQSQMF